MRPPSDSKSPIEEARDRFPGAGLIPATLNISGDLPDGAIFFCGGRRSTRQPLSIKSLNRRRGFLTGKRLGRFDSWRRTYLGDRLLSSSSLLGSRRLGSEA